MSYCMGIATPTPYWKATPTARKPPLPRASGEIANCSFWMHVNTQLDCGVMVEKFDLTMSDFYAMNPSVGVDCLNLSLGFYYCIETPDIPAIDGDVSITRNPISTKPPTASGTPSSIQDGMVSGCTKFYLVVADDRCWAIANQNSISLDDFYAWNPAVGKDCATLQPNYCVCIGRASITTSHATTTRVSTISSATTTKPAALGPAQSGIPADCNTRVAQKDGVYCYDMAQSAGISLDRLYALNLALNGDCSGLWPGYAYCIGTF